MARRVAGVPLPVYFAIGAAIGIVLTMVVLTVVRRSSSPRPVAQASAAVTRATPVVESARGLVVWRPASGVARVAPEER